MKPVNINELYKDVEEQNLYARKAYDDQKMRSDELEKELTQQSLGEHYLRDELEQYKTENAQPRYIDIVETRPTDMDANLVNHGKGNQGYANYGDNNRGSFNEGNNNQGSYNSGSNNVGDYNAGDNNIGDYDRGHGNIGNHDVGNNNVGDWLTGNNRHRSPHRHHAPHPRHHHHAAHIRAEGDVPSRAHVAKLESHVARDLTALETNKTNHPSDGQEGRDHVPYKLIDHEKNQERYLTYSLDRDLKTGNDEGRSVDYQALNNLENNVDNTQPDGGVHAQYEALCFCSGSLVRTSTRGDVPVENLKMGEAVITAQGEHKVIKWLGWQQLHFKGGCVDRRNTPICITKHAIDTFTPYQDLYLSPAHGVGFHAATAFSLPFLKPRRRHILVRAGSLINHKTIFYTSSPCVTYWHIELASHECLIVNGLSAESYKEDNNRHYFNNSAQVAIDQRVRPEKPSLPRKCRGFQVNAIRHQIQKRATLFKKKDRS